MSADVAAVAAEALAAIDQARQIGPFSYRIAGFDLDFAYAVAWAATQRRQARGERPVGRKIGFTNRTIWSTYGVYAPIWGYVYDTTMRELGAGRGAVALDGFCEPQIEPEIVFKFRHAPQSGMDDAAIFDCVEWVAHGFEIVQSIFPGWKFAAADTVAAGGLHGALLLGPTHRLERAERETWLAQLRSFDIALSSNGREVDRGSAANVLDGPLSAVRYLAALLDNDPRNPPLSAGEIVTTETVTRAWPIAAGEAWSTEIFGLPLAGLSVEFA